MRYRTGPASRTVALYDAGPTSGHKANRTTFALIAAFMAAFLAAATFVSVGYFALTTRAQAQSVECDKYAAPTGSNFGSGTYSAPYGTVQKLVNSLSAGQTGCLRAGTYTEGDERVAVSRGGASDASRITVQNYPGEEAIIRAQVKVNPGADFVTFRSAPGERWSLVLDGTGGPVNRNRTNQGRHATSPSPLIHSNDTEWVDLDITKRSQGLSSAELYRTGVCVLIGKASIPVSGTRVEGNRIHGCGLMHDQEDNSYIPNFFGPGEDLDNRASGGPDNHGVYVSTTSGTTTIKDNLIFSNGERGVQLYPNASGVLVENNVFDENGQGLVFDGAAADNTVRDNIFTLATYTWNAYDAGGLRGAGNRFEGNCVWASNGTSGLKLSSKVAQSGTVVAKALYRNRELRDYSLASDSPCLGKGPGYVQP